jgi:seryl-tRNA synthetase
MAVELIKTHKEIFQKEVEIRQVYMESCDIKIQLMETMNIIENMQLNEYDKSREASITETSKEIEEMDKELIVRISEMQKEVKQIKEISKFVTSQIEEINKTIPKEGMATNYKVNFKDNIGGRCVP